MKILACLQKFRGKINFLWERLPLVASFFVFLAVFGMYSSIYLNNPGISSIDDHFFHFKYAELLRTDGWSAVKNFKWIYYSKSVQDGQRYSLTLYNLSLIPFTYFQDKILGLKLADIFFGALAVGLLYYLMRKLRIRLSLLYVLMLLSVEYFLVRDIIGRAYILAVVLVFWEAYAAVNNRNVILFMLCLFHVLWHPASFFLLPFVVSLVELVRYVRINKFNFNNIIAVLAGLLLGFVFYPGFLKHFFEIMGGIIQLHQGISRGQAIGNIEGIELFPKEPSFIYKYAFVLLYFILSIGFSFYLYLKGRGLNKTVRIKWQQDVMQIVLIFMVSVFLLGSLVISGRFYDFFIVGSIISFALASTIAWEIGEIKIAEQLRWFLLIPLMIFLLGFVSNSFINTKLTIANVNYDITGNASSWIKNKGKKDEIVFLESWNYFPIAFFYNADDYYTVGLEPRLMYEADEKLFWKWYNISRNAYYCEETKDCSDRKNEEIEKISQDSEKKERYFDKLGIDLINSIKNDFNCKFAIIESSELNYAISKHKEMIEDQFKSEKKELNYSITAYEFK